MKQIMKDPLLKEFKMLAKYMPDSPIKKYQLRYKNKFICAETPEILFVKFKSIYDEYNN